MPNLRRAMRRDVGISVLEFKFRCGCVSTQNRVSWLPEQMGIIGPKTGRINRIVILPGVPGWASKGRGQPAQGLAPPQKYHGYRFDLVRILIFCFYLFSSFFLSMQGKPLATFITYFLLLVLFTLAASQVVGPQCCPTIADCQQCDNDYICNTCQGYAIRTNDNSSCVNCSNFIANCYGCTNATVCTSCLPGYAFDANNVCVLQIV